MNDWLLQEARDIRLAARQLLAIADDLENRSRGGRAEAARGIVEARLILKPADDAAEQDQARNPSILCALRIHHARRRRSSHFPPALFAEPAWDMLVSLYVLRMVGGQVRDLAACLTTPLQGSTVARWGKILLEAGLVECRQSALDESGFEYRLTDQGLSAMHRYLSELGDLAGPAVMSGPLAPD